MAKTWKILSWNVNGLRAVARKGFFHPLFVQQEPAIVCLQETKAHPDQLGEEIKNISGYRSSFAWAQKKGYSGVATFTREPPLQEIVGTGQERYDQEGRVLIHVYPEFVLFNAYFPNGKQRPERFAFKMAFYRDFLKLIKAYRARVGHDRFVICGDVNTAHKEIDLAHPKENAKSSGFLPEERSWIDEFLADGFVDTFRCFVGDPGHYTWWDMLTRARERNVGWRIDYFFISESLKPHLKKAFILSDVYGSDHCPIGISLTF